MAAVEHQVQVVMRQQTDVLSRVQTWQDLQHWVGTIVEMTRSRHGAHGCPIGSLVSQLADHSDGARVQLEDAFRYWESLLASALARMQSNGEIDRATNVRETAIGILATLQGGFILAQTAHDERRLEAALNVAINRIDGPPTTSASSHE